MAMRPPKGGIRNEMKEKTMRHDGADLRGEGCWVYGSIPCGYGG